MNPSLRFGTIGYFGLLSSVATAYYLPWGLLNIVPVVALGAAFAGLGWASMPKKEPSESPPPVAPPIGQTHHQSASLDELKVSADTGKALAKDRGNADLALDMPGLTLRLGKASASAQKRDETLASTNSGTLEEVN